MLDDGMVYWDVRPSANFPTVEVRVADVPATVAETVLFAALVRGCVMTALDDERHGEPIAPLAPHALRAAYWMAAREGLDGNAIDLTESHAAVPAVDLLDRLTDRIRPALDAVGDYEMVRTELTRIAEHGNGAMRQRRAWQRRHDVADVLAEAAAATRECAGAGARQISGSSANGWLVGCSEPLPGSTVNASALRRPEVGQHRGGRRCDGLGVHRACRLRGPSSPTSHI